MLDLKRHGSEESGFTVVELVVSAAILFFVLTAILGLVGASQRMGVSARQRAIVTNAISWYTDSVIKGRPWSEMGVQGHDASGTIQPSYSRYFGGSYVQYTVSTLVFTDFYKEFRVTCSTTLNGKEFSASSIVGVKNPNSNRTTASIIDPNAPTLTWGDSSVMPSQFEVLFNAERYNPPSGAETASKFVATANAKTGFTIVDVQYLIGNQLLHAPGGTYAGDAHWTFSPGLTSTTNWIVWDTTQAGVGDGFQTIVGVCQDSDGRTGRATRTVIVDNVAPGAPGAPVGTARTDAQGGVISWSAVLDPPAGTNKSYAYQYRYDLYQEPSTTVVGQPPSGWIPQGTTTMVPGSDTAKAVANAGPISSYVSTQPFSRYWCNLEAGSPRGLWNAGEGLMAKPFISRPDIKTASPSQSTAKCVISGSTVYFQTVLYVQNPNFPADTLSYQVRYLDSSAASPVWAVMPATVTTSTVGTTTKLAFTFTGSKTTANKPYFFDVGVKLRPLGWQGGAVVPDWIYTNAVGVTPTVNGTTNNLIDQGWGQ